ncbi:hypothetical protein ACFO6R_06040 [Eubacterium multiforme]|uniref:Uncharacterized protein n=1 Tax=Eubacterium multiforme TaxID=83339 RepID=A0ABT9US51_9FIRM|nr:hypothetical protein [Eubacterium multiforme]MDQ0149145.1 hypothetical protein [Eubacterium multiforme]
MSKLLYKIRWSDKNIMKSEHISYVAASSWDNAEKKMRKVFKASNVEVESFYCEDTKHVFIAD